MVADIIIGCIAVFFAGLFIYKICKRKNTCGCRQGCTGCGKGKNCVKK